jgi:hypothetical protein
MYRSLRYSYGLSSRMSLLLLVLMLTVSCSKGPLSLLTGGGPNVAANTQIGRENNQGVTTNIDRSIRPQLRPEGPVENLTQDNSTTNNTEIDPLLLLLLIAGWLAPSPQEIGRGIGKWLKGLISRK